MTSNAARNETASEFAAEEETTKRDAVLVVTPPAEEEAEDDEFEEKENTKIIEDQNVIRAISSVVEKLDRMEDQLKEGVDPARASNAVTPRPRTRPDHRDFIIAYDGSFVGHFRTDKRISNKKAFQKAATALRDKIYDFDPRLLNLYRPVLVKIDNPESIPYVDGESFNWFGSAPSKVEA